MPALTSRAQKLCYLATRRVAIVYLNGKRITVGPWPEYPKPPSAEIQAKYRALIAAPEKKVIHPGGITVAILCDRITDWAAEYYRDQDKDRHAVMTGCGVMLAVCDPATLVESLLPSHIVAMRETLVRQGRTRQGVNKVLGFIRRILRRGCELGLVTPSVLTGCLVVQGLRPGRTVAPESIRRSGVADDVLQTTLIELKPMFADMARLQRCTGMRPNEVCRMRWAEIDQSSETWVYRPTRHKCAWRGQSREIYLGPQAQTILRQWRYLDGLPVFSPSRLGGINTEVECAPTTYCRAVAAACKKAKVPKWSPQDLRKAAAQEFRDAFSLETSAALLGHGVDVNQRHYSTHSRKAAAEAAKKLG